MFIFCRSTQQYQVFLNIFQTWLKKEGRHEINKGLTGLTVTPILLPMEDKNVIKTVQNEINTLCNLVNLKHKNQNPSKDLEIQQKDDSTWIKEFMIVLSCTDDVFMNYLLRV